MNKPLISIILSTYNGSKYITDSIKSVLNQTYENFEFIIINDFSNDNVEDIILNFQKKDNRIIYIKNKKNLKLTKSLNKGLKIAKGKYIARIDDDDIWFPEKLKKQVDFMEKNKDYGLCGTSTIIIKDNGDKIEKVKMRKTNEEIKNNILKSNQFTHSSIIIRKSILDKVGGFYNEKYNGAEDYELWLRIGKISKFYNIPDFLVKYRWLETSISRKKWFRQEILSFKIMLLYKKYYNYFYKAFILRLSSILIPQKIKKSLLNIIN